MVVPIIIICYNNYKYVQNTVKQIQKINRNYYNYIQILDNCSTCSDTKNYLKIVDCKVIHNTKNGGPWINSERNKFLYDTLPEKFILTDPDLQFNENLPNDFIEKMVELSNKYKCRKIGFALDISDFDVMYQDKYCLNRTIYDWEKQFWQKKINNDEYELYQAPIDTTFCLINKQIWEKFENSDIRMAGNFTAKHLPWYRKPKLFSLYDNYKLNSNTSNISTIAHVIVRYINANYWVIRKNNEKFLIEKNENEKNIKFWTYTYTNWEKDSFQLLDKYLNKDKIFIEMGSSNGAISMYASRKSKHIYSIESDTKSFDDLKINMENNCEKNYTLINRSFHNETNGFQRFMESNNIVPNEIALINVNIEGGEEIILNDLYEFHTKYNVSFYVKFHLSSWIDKNIDRFEFLTESQKDVINKNEFADILFSIV
jgi:hypothetical protein